MKREDKLNAKFAEAYATLMNEKYPGRSYLENWYPRLLVIHEEHGGLELEFSLSSDFGLDDDECQAIQNVVGGIAEPGDVEGGCDTCGFGARQVIYVRGGVLPSKCEVIDRRPSLAERRVALGLSSPSAAERRETLAENLDDLTKG